MSKYIEKLFSLEGKVAVVIGGTGVLCGAMAEGLAQAGAEVVLVGRSPEKAQERIKSIESFGGKVWFHSCDVASRPELEALKNAVVQKSKGIDILINGAGINSPTPFFDISDEEFQKIMTINLQAVFQACQIFGKYFIENGRNASIINIGSISGLLPLSRVFTYSMSKGALHNLSKNLAREWATKKVRVNTLVPGFFPAEQNRKILNEERVNDIMRHTPMKRFGEANELVGATLLLASDAGAFITGHEMIVDGGFSSTSI